MNRQIKKITFTLILICIVAGCANKSAGGIDPEIEILVPQIPTQKIRIRPQKLDYQPVITVGLFLDSRVSFDILDLDGDTRVAKGEAAYLVTFAVRRLYKRMGFKVTTKAPVTVSGAITKWKAGERKEKGTRIAIAEINIQVVTPSAAIIFNKIFKGIKSSRSRWRNDIAIREALGEAMSNALQEMMNDAELTEVLTSF